MFAIVVVAVVLVLVAAACTNSGGGSRADTNAGTKSDTSPVAGGATTTSTTSPTGTPGQSAAPGLPAGVSNGTLRDDGRERTYRLYVPPVVAATMSKAGTGAALVPLVVALHGGLGTPDQFAGATGIEALAAREGFVVVHPAGVSRTWNAGRCCGPAVTADVDDVGFLAALVADLSQRLPIDPARVFAIGHSNGAMMAWRAACDRADVFAAVVVVAGSLETTDGRCTASRGVSLLAIHGDADQNHPINGGVGDRSVSNVAYRSMATSLATWTSTQRCGAPTAPTTVGPLNTTVWRSCRDNTETRYVVVAGADHPWPGSTADRTSALQGTPSTALDATATAWAFLRDHPRR